MKEFEKWFGEELDRDIGSLLSTDKHYRWRSRDDWAKDAWRAALDWVLTHKKPIKYRDYKFWYIKTGVIEEELE